ncbi:MULTISPECIES: bifunctional transcriptional activator/DNA repair enzyme AdaA [unclassified Virgibacillus]|uniref:bifunctional transcriptional activator/DNA repair enzyme AdaA n=1 Tax=unclassified Virgibacillus TaxID=2620237 RepID=UPI0024DE1DF3|nr:bifunctional transcriptional activator/DNA repair enzyme AdaA [Virgibacillus sp. LDC-1]
MFASLTEEQWHAIITNDATFDNTFLYGVGSTGIFCRPSCKSRNPKKEYVKIFKDAQQAIAEGFRPCKRCKPCDLRMPDEDWTLKIKAYINEHYDKPLTLAHLADQCHGSPYHLQKTFKRIMHISPIAYLQRVRIAHAKQELVETEKSIANIGVNVGIPNTSYFITLFKRQTGTTPKQFRLSFQKES